LPGGAAEAGESPDETVLREVREEGGLDVAVLHLTGYYHDAEADFLHFVFLCEMRAGAAAPRPISDFTIRRIQDAVAEVKFRLPSRVGPRVWLE
jgi:8-oxo-dGTP diphosphatase